MKRRKSLSDNRERAVPAARVDGTGKTWGIWVTDHLWIASKGSVRPASKWYQWWQRFLLGWRWEQR